MSAPFGSNSEARQETTQASDTGRAVSGRQASLTESGAISVGVRGNYREGGSLDQSYNRGQIGGAKAGHDLEINDLSNTTINTLDGGAIQSAFDLVRDVLARNPGSTGGSDVAGGVLDTGTTLDDQPGAVTDLIANKWFWIGLGALGFIFFVWKNR